MITEITKERFRRFRSIKRAYYSLWILVVAFIVSLGSELISNDRPLLAYHDGSFYFPVFTFYSEQDFGGPYGTEPDYHKMNDAGYFSSGKGWMIFPVLPYGPYRINMDREGNPPHPPSLSHPLGTDGSARDIASRLLYGFRISMLFALSLMLIAAFLGVTLGGIQGFLGGRFDILMQRGVEIWSALPFLYVVILLGSIYGQNFGMLLFVMGLFAWISLSYYMRGEFYRIRNMNYIQMARALGMSRTHIFFKQILPNALTPVVTILPFTLISGIGALTSLDFLGFGLKPPTPSWGEMLSQGLNHLDSPWIAMSATGALFITLLLATFIGEGAREAFDPKAMPKSAQAQGAMPAQKNADVPKTGDVQ